MKSPRCQETLCREQQGSGPARQISEDPPPSHSCLFTLLQSAVCPLPETLHLSWAVSPSGTLTASSRSSFSILGGTARSREDRRSLTGPNSHGAGSQAPTGSVFLPIPSHLLPWGRGSNKNLQLAETNTSATGRRPQSEEGSWVVLKIFAPFHLGLVLDVSGKFYGSLREEAADEAKKTRLGLSLLSVLGPPLEAPRLGGRMGGRL